VFFRDPLPAQAEAIDKYILAFGRPSPWDREQARDALFDIGYWSVGPLLATVAKEKAQFKSSALLVLGRMRDRRALPGARAEVKDDVSEWPPVIAALVLGRFRDAEEPTLAALKTVVDSRQNEKRRVAVALTLGKIFRKAPADGSALLDMLLDAPTASPSVGYAAMLATGFYRSRVAEQAPDQAGFRPSKRIREALGDTRSDMRLSAVLALAISTQDSFRPVFVDRWRNDGNAEVRRAALLALGRPPPDRRPDPETTDLLGDALSSTRSSAEERRMAVYLLNLRSDPASMGALWKAATEPRAPEIAAAALVALGGIDDARVPDLVLGKLADRSATVRAAAAVACTRLRKREDLDRAAAQLRARLQQGETDPNARDDLQRAYDEIGRILRDRDDAANGIEPKKRPPVEWAEADAKDLFYVLGRTHRERVFDLVNLRVLQVLGIAGLPSYRPNEPFENPPPEAPDDRPTVPGNPTRPRREHQVFGEPYDVRVELDRRPFYGPEDDPDVAPAPVPK
jgi:HEAT repeat protein